MTSGWNRRRASRAAAAILLLAMATTASAVDRVRPSAQAASSDAWNRYGALDRAWAASWPSDWEAGERLTEASGDSLSAALQRALNGALAVAEGGADRDAPDPSLVSWSLRLRDRWHDRGYLMCRVEVIRQGGTPSMIVDPGVKFRIGRIEVTGDRGPAARARCELWLPRTGDPCDGETWNRAIAGLLRDAGDAGHPFAGWDVQDVRVDPIAGVVDVRASFSQGEALVWGPVTSNLVRGAAHDFLVRTAGIAKGRPFRQSDLRAARRRLMARNIYLRVADPVVFVPAAPGSVGVHWSVTPRPRPNRMALMLGLSRPDGDQGTRLSGQADLLLGNIAGTGRRLELAWSDNGLDRSHFGFGWLEPLVAGTPLDVAVALDQEIVDDVHSRLRLDADLSLPLRADWSVELGVGRDRGTYPVGQWIRSHRWRTKGALRHRRLDRYRSGWDGLFVVESARRSAEARPEQEGGSVPILQEERQTLVRMDADGEIMLRRALAIGVRGSYAGVSGDAEVVPLVEQYRLGGARSLRGYREDQFHGEQTAALSLEMRLGVPGRSRVYTFLDLGYVRQSRRDPATDTVVTSTDHLRGFGLGIETKGVGGDVSLAVGFPGSLGFDEAKLHVSLQQTF